MRIKATIFFRMITIIFAIFGVIGFTIAIIAGNDLVRVISAALLFVTGYVAALIHSKL